MNLRYTALGSYKTMQKADETTECLYEFAQFRLSQTERSLTCGDQPVHLPPKVFDTLILLVENNGHLIEKDELLEKVWADSIVEEGTIARNISVLRRVLGETENGGKFIETVTKRGYRFVAEVRLSKHEASALRLRTSRGRRDTTRRLSSENTLLKSIAVLPFRWLGAKNGDEYLGLGMTDALISQLSNTRRIIVRPTSSVLRYARLPADPITAGKEMHVDSVLDGSIQRDDDRLRVTVQLISVRKEISLWAETFDESFTDIFAVQDSISRRVADALALRLSGEKRKRLTERYTENTVAYHLYLKGRYYWNKRTEETVHKAIDCFQQALDLDPNYALAYAGLADCFTKLGDVGVTAIIPKEAFSRARHAALRAIEIDGSLAEVHASLGHLDMHILEWGDAEKDFKRAIELDPNYATAHQWYAYFMAFHRRFDEALDEIKVALNLDPLSLPIADSVGEFLYFARRYDEAIEQFLKVLEMDSNFLASRINLGRAYEQTARFGEAEDQFLKAREIAGESIDALANLGHSYAMSGNSISALEILGQLTELSKKRYVSPYDIALIHAELGETDEAFRWLAEAYDQRVEWMIYTNVDPRLDPLRADPRFSDLLGQLGFSPASHGAG